MRPDFGYRRLATPLHAAGAAAGLAYSAALTMAALLLDHPLELAVLLLVTCGAAVAGGAGPELRRFAPWALLPVLLFAVVNALVSRDGLTVVARLGEVPPFGQLDITLEALAYGSVYGLKLTVSAVAFLLFTVAVDPDETLRFVRRISPRTGVAAALASRMVPVLAADARRVAEAQRCRPERSRSSRIALLRALIAGSLDRAVDLAATLELRGYAERTPRPPAGRRRAGSRHEIAFALSSAGLVVLAAGARLAGVAGWTADPVLHGPVGVGELALALCWAPMALLPFVDRRGIEP
ncbi:MAG: energy-coupling factor transporter transmembrane component T [Solirubrobacteraceae bacterium]